MRVATVDGLVTLFYDGSKELWNRELIGERYYTYGYSNEDEEDIESLDLSEECKRHWRERLSWQQIIVVDGVTEIPERTFHSCWNIRRVIFADTVIRIQRFAFVRCKNLVSVKLSLRLEYIGFNAFYCCDLSGVFIPPRCREIGDYAFACNENLSILNVPQDADLGRFVVSNTALVKASPYNWYGLEDNENMNQWVKNINNEEKFALHRACASFQPRREVINAIVEEKGLETFKEENSAGINPSRYLKENPHTDLKEKEIIRYYLLKMMGEVE